MITADADILIVPGLGGSAEDHWQSRWERQLSSARRVPQTDWDHPNLANWLRNLTQALSEATKPPVIIGHSLGALTIAHLPEDLAAKVKGAMLVTPPSLTSVLQIAEIDPAFAELPGRPLPFPALLVASRDDPYSTYEESEKLAADLGAELVDAGPAGHINLDSGHGPWPEGLMRFAGFMKKL